MKAIASDNSTLSLSVREVISDPLQLFNVGAIYLKRVSFSAPIGEALVEFVVALIAAPDSRMLVIPVHLVFQKVTAGAATLAVVTLMGGLGLQNVTEAAVATLVNQLGPTTTNLHPGNMVPALTLLAVTCLSAVVMTEYSLEKVQEKITREAEEVVSWGAGKTMNPVAVRDSKNVVTSVNKRGSSTESDGGFVGRLGGGATRRGGVPQGAGLATDLMKKTNGDGRLATGHNAV